MTAGSEAEFSAKNNDLTAVADYDEFAASIPAPGAYSAAALAEGESMAEQPAVEESAQPAPEEKEDVGSGENTGSSAAQEESSGGAGGVIAVIVVAAVVAGGAWVVLKKKKV